MKVSSAKQKGRRLQKWVAGKISTLLNLKCGPDESIRSREMGQSGVDVVLIGEAREQFPFDIECKNCETWSVHKWIQQAKSNSTGTNWLLFCKRNRTDPVVILDAIRFFDIYKELLLERMKNEEST